MRGKEKSEGWRERERCLEKHVRKAQTKRQRRKEEGGGKKRGRRKKEIKGRKVGDKVRILYSETGEWTDPTALNSNS